MLASWKDLAPSRVMTRITWSVKVLCACICCCGQQANRLIWHLEWTVAEKVDCGDDDMVSPHLSNEHELGGEEEAVAALDQHFYALEIVMSYAEIDVLWHGLKSEGGMCSAAVRLPAHHLLPAPELLVACFGFELGKEDGPQIVTLGMVFWQVVRPVELHRYSHTG